MLRFVKHLYIDCYHYQSLLIEGGQVLINKMKWRLLFVIEIISYYTVVMSYKVLLTYDIMSK